MTDRIKCILFDCDNTLVLSEPLAFAACSDLSNEILDTYAPHVSHRYTGPTLQREFVGKNFRALIAALEAKHDFLMPTEDIDGWVGRELSTTIGKIQSGAEPCRGVMEVLARLQTEGKYMLAIVSSSALPRVLASIDTVGQDKFFPRDRVFSAASMVPPTSKPDPAVYLHACETLGFAPTECIAIEDSRSGATAATRAGIPLMGYVGPYYDEECGEKEAKAVDRMLREECSAKAVMHHWSEFEARLQEMQA